MYRDILTNKWILGGLGFLIIFAGLCYVWYQHTTAPYREETAKLDQIRRQSEKQQTAPTAKPTEPAVKKLTQSTSQNVEEPVSPELPRIGDIVDGRIFLGTEKPSPELLSQLRSQDELISPYGFGPYPELPTGFGPITWPRKSVNSELMIRMEIALLNQGVPVEGISMKNGLIYPIIKGVRYITWGETSDGRRYLRRSLGHPDDGDYLRALANEKEAEGEVLTQADVPHIKLVPMEEGGIDPYTFLDLPK